MSVFASTNQMAEEIASLARLASQKLTDSQDALKVCKSRIVCPVDYMRYPEFQSILDRLQIHDGENILDVSSPQWFTLCLAKRYPKANFYYINITDNELVPYSKVATALGIDNIQYKKDDVRDMGFEDDFFDTAISISVIEHVYPEEGGDIKALEGINRVLKTGGSLLLTVPFKKKHSVIYMDGDVYERSGKERTFYAREYDSDSFAALMVSSPLQLNDKIYIEEKKGLFSLDYFQWGPGRGNPIYSALIKIKKISERVLGFSIDQILAKKYLCLSAEPDFRLVNIFAKLTKHS